MSAHKNHTHPHDFGLPPWPVKTVSLNSSQLAEHSDLSERIPRLIVLVSWAEHGFLFREFDAYFAPLDGKHGIHAKFHREHYNQSDRPPKCDWSDCIVSGGTGKPDTG